MVFETWKNMFILNIHEYFVYGMVKFIIIPRVRSLQWNPIFHFGQAWEMFGILVYLYYHNLAKFPREPLPTLTNVCCAHMLNLPTAA